MCAQKGIKYFGRREVSNASHNVTSFRSLDGNSKPYFRGYCHDFPQDTQLSGWYLSNHHWRIGSRRVLQGIKNESAWHAQIA
jgi:hypothetical protein